MHKSSFRSIQATEEEKIQKENTLKTFSLSTLNHHKELFHYSVIKYWGCDVS